MNKRFKTWSFEDIYNFQLFLSGNERGFTYLYGLLYKSSFYFASNLLKDNFEIDCIIQDAFLHAWLKREKFENVFHLSCSIKLYIRNRCMRHQKTEWHRTSIFIDLNGLEHTFQCDWESESEIQTRERYAEELAALLNNAIPYLPITSKNILTLYNKGVSPKKIANHLGVSIQKINAEISKGARHLKFVFPILHKAHKAGQKIKKTPIVNYEAYLNKQQAQICTLLYKNKLPFSLIARQLGLAPFKLLKEHYAAMSILKNIKTY